MSASSVSNPICDNKATEENNNISTPMLSRSGKKILSLGYLDASASLNRSGGEFAAYSSTSGSGGFKFGSSKGGSEFDTYPKIKTEHVSGAVTGNIPSPSKVKTGKNNVIEYMEDDVD